MKRNFLLQITAVALSLAVITSVSAKQSWSAWVKQVRAEAIEKGIRPAVFDKAFATIKRPNRRVLHFDRTQPEKRLTYLKYRNTRADRYRIIIGRKEIKRHARILNEVSQKYGVSTCFITSLWGLETSYGNFMGSFPVIKSLATLAYDSRRATFFRKQLFHALKILDGGHVKLKDFKGEWAGASGMPQFLPSSWEHYAVDYNGDGRKDIWKTHSDVFASIANYLIQHGWKSGQPWMVHVRVPGHFNDALMTRKVKKSVSEWEQMGVRAVNGEQLPAGDLQASVVHPYGGPTMMVFNNFNVIMRWNRSIYYAGTVGYLAEKICKIKL